MFLYHNKFIKLLLILFFILLSFYFLFNYFDFFKDLESRLLDKQIYLQGERAPDIQTSIIKFDQQSFKEIDAQLDGNFGQQYINLMRNLTAAGSRLIGFDLLFSNSIGSEIDTLIGRVTDSLKIVVHCFALSSDAEDTSIDKKSDEIYTKFALNDFDADFLNIWEATYGIFPDKTFIHAFNSAGSISNEQVIDNAIRRITLFTKYNKKIFPAFGLKILMNYFNCSDDSLEIISNSWSKKLILNTYQGKIEIPINSRGQALLNYYGILDVYHTIPLHRLLVHKEGKNTRKIADSLYTSLSGKIVLIGRTDFKWDEYNTPFSVRFPGVGIHATFISNVLKGDIIREADWKLNFIITLILCLLIYINYFSLSRQKKNWQPFFYAVSLIVLIGSNLIAVYIVFQKFFIWLKLLQINISAISYFVFLIFYEKHSTLRKVNKELNQLRLTLEQKKLSYSDLYTQISEKDQIFNLLKEYISTIENCITNSATILSQKNTDVLCQQKFLMDRLENQIHFLTNEKLRSEIEIKSLEETIQNLTLPNTESNIRNEPLDYKKYIQTIFRYWQYFELHKQNSDLYYKFNIVGLLKVLNEEGLLESTPMSQLYLDIERICDSNREVIILGETGVGKELIARAIHAQSQKYKKVFFPFNCAALNAELLSSDLFGHKKGAFSTAYYDRSGAFKEANGGMLFLDEIGDLPLNLQPGFLRVLQEKRIRPVGGEIKDEISVDVRVLAATNKNLKEMLELQQFREDLYHRISVFELKIPPLRERIYDIPFLIWHFLNKLNAQYKKNKLISAETVWALMCYSWPGNIRELGNLIERLYCWSDGILKLDPIRDREICETYQEISHQAGNLIIEELQKIFRIELDHIYERCKTAIINNSFDTLFKSEINKAKDIKNCYDYLTEFIDDLFLIYPKETKDEEVEKGLVFLFNKLNVWRNEANIMKLDEFDVVTKNYLGRTRRTITEWKQKYKDYNWINIDSI